MKKAIKFGSSNSGFKIGLGGLAALNASLTTAKSFNQTFEGQEAPNQPNLPNEEKKEALHVFQPHPEPPKDLPPRTFQPQKPAAQEDQPFKKRSFEENPKKTNNEGNRFEAARWKKPVFEGFKKEPDSPRYHEDHYRSKGFDHEKPKKNRSLSPQPQRTSGLESRVPPKEFPKKRGLIGKQATIEPDMTIDMRSAENTSIFELNLSETTTKLLTKRNIYNLFPLQVQAFEPIKKGVDFIGKAKTGTGKTMAFAIPLLERLRETKVRRIPKILVVSPTRELANQITEEFKYYGPEFRVVCCYGGVPLTRQIEMINRGLEIIVATPGRLLDLMGRKVIPLEHVSTVVVDEADHMMDIGFKDDLDEILSVINRYVSDLQLLLFSATIPPWIKGIISTYIKPDKLFIDAVGNENQTADKIKHYAIPCTDEDLEKTLEIVISYYANKGKALIFTDTKSHVAQLTTRLENGINRVGCLHGDMNQYSRDQTISAFKNGEMTCLIATDVAARGLDIPNVELVFQVRPPQNIANYIHRSGRTGRVGKEGISVLMFNPKEDNDILSEIEKKASIEFERRGIPTQEEFIDLRNQLQKELKQARLQDKERLMNGERFKAFDAAPRMKLEDSLDKLSQQHYFLSRSILTGNSRKVTFQFTSNTNKKKYELKSAVEKLLDGIFLHSVAFCNKDGGLLVDVADEQKKEILQRLEKQGDIVGTIPIWVPEHRFAHNQNSEGGHSLNHKGREGKGRGHGYNPKFHKTNSTSSQLNSFGNNPKKSSNANSFFVRNKDY